MNLKLESMKRTQYIFAVLFLLMFSAGPLNAASPFSGGSGTKTDPYRISNQADWNSLADFYISYLGEYFVLTADISVDRMIGVNTSSSFSGFFDGGGHTITVNYNTSEPYVAPFRYVENATIQNLHVEGTITTSAKYAGGIVGHLYTKKHKNSYLTLCSSSVTINSSVNGDGSHGGLVGHMEGTDAYAKVYITDCFFDGKFLGPDTDSWGGLVGWKGNDFVLTFEKCLFDPSQVNVKAGGIVNLYRCNYIDDNNVIYRAGVYWREKESYSADELVNRIGSNWDTDGNKILLVLEPKASYSGSGTSANPYVIASAANWNYLVQKVSEGNTFIGKYFVLTNDIKVHRMLGTGSSKFFGGNFNGQGHTLTIRYAQESGYCAPFRYIHDAYIQNLHVAGSIYAVSKNAGGIAGHVQGANSIVRCRSSVAITHTNDGDGSSGGLVGEIVSGGTDLYFVDCLFDGKLLGSKTKCWGGFGGWKEDGPDVYFTNCLFNPSELNVKSGDNETLVRNDQGSRVHITNSYYAKDLGNAQGSNGKSMTEDQLATALGTQWELEDQCARPKMTDAPMPLSGDGSAGNPYLIASTANWDYLVSHYSSSSATYNGKFFKLVADISIEKMLGNDTNPFNGTFDGNGKTLILALSSDSHTDYLAPFPYLNGATIKNLRLTGSITTAGEHPASVASYVNGTCNILNCYSAVAITASRSDLIEAGAFVARVPASQRLDITGCAFAGSIEYTAEGGKEGGSFVGRKDNSGVVNIYDCVYAPSVIVHTVGPKNTVENQCHKIFVSGYAAADNLSRCYYNKVIADAALFDVEGRCMYTVTGAEHMSVAMNGTTSVSYNVSGITAYNSGDTKHPGLVFDGVIYGGAGETLPLLLTHEGGKVESYRAKDEKGTLTGTAVTGTNDAYTLLLVESDAVIEALGVIVLDETVDNSTEITTAADGHPRTISLLRTLVGGEWNSFCVPFDVSAEMIASVFGQGTQVKVLVYSSMDGDGLTVGFSDASSIEAGKPYLIMPSSDTQNPLFENVYLSTATTTASTTVADFVPVIKPKTDFTARDKTVLFFAGDGTLSFPSEDGTLYGFRAYIQLKGAAVPDPEP